MPITDSNLLPSHSMSKCWKEGKRSSPIELIVDFFLLVEEIGKGFSVSPCYPSRSLSLWLFVCYFFFCFSIMDITNYLSIKKAHA